MRCLFLLLFLFYTSAQAEDSDFYLEGNKYVSADIVSASSTLSSAPASDTLIGIQFRIAEGWHIYWKNSGESGLPTQVVWNVPQGWKLSPLNWPAPYRLIEQGDITTFGYHENVTLVSTLSRTTDSVESNAPLRVEARLSWLVCKEICVPGRSNISREFSVQAASPTTDAQQSLLINQAYRTTPQWPASNPKHKALTSITHFASYADQQVVVIEVSGLPSLPTNPHTALQVFPNSSAAIKFGKPVLLHSETKLAVALPFGLLKDDPNISALAGTIVLSDKLLGVGHPVSLPWRTQGSESAQQINSKDHDKELNYRLIDHNTPSEQLESWPKAPIATATTQTSGSLILALLASLAAGLLLNIMPCVLPVISIKIMSFMEGAGENAKVNRLSVAAFSLGILCSFLALGGLVAGLRNLGHQVGWGFQFQYPGFVLALIIIVFVLALGFFELYTIQAPGLKQASRNADSIKSRYFRNFADGVLATLLATPCAAPFLGTALAFAFTQPAYIIYFVFLFIGIGLALPYALIASSSRVLNWLPRPGPWMFQVRELMGILLLATVIWLVYVLGKFSDLAAATALALLLIIFFAFRVRLWIFESNLGHRAKQFYYLSLWLICIYALFSGWQIIHQATDPSIDTSQQVSWQPYSDELIEQGLASNKPIFIDFTAAWCITCKANEKLVLSSSSVIQAFKKHQILAIKADWTTGDSKVGKALRKYGGDAVPFYVVVPADRTAEPKILPTILTPGIVIDALEQASS